MSRSVDAGFGRSDTRVRYSRLGYPRFLVPKSGVLVVIEYQMRGALKNMSSENRIWRLLLGVMLCAVPLSAQVVTGTISGRVTDSTGAVIAGTMVQIQNTETGLTRNVESDTAGRYEARNLPAGSYSVTAQQAGFKTEVRSGITLTVASEAVVNLELSVGEVLEKVEVTAEAPAIETTNATLSGLVGEQQIRDLPLNGRSYDQLALLAPSVIRQTSGGNGLWGRESSYRATAHE